MPYSGYTTMGIRPTRPSFPAKTDKAKHVFGAHDTGVEHVWAHPKEYPQTDARNKQANIYFKTFGDARVLYSWRDDYPIANLFKVGKRTVYLVRSGTPYSATTSQHMSSAYHAVPDKEMRFAVPEVCEHYSDIPSKQTHEANLADIVSRLSDAIAKYEHVRSSHRMRYLFDDIKPLEEMARKYARVFKLKLPKLPKLPTWDAKRFAAIQAKEKFRSDNAEAIERERQAKYEAKQADSIARWKAGEDVELGSYQRYGRRRHWMRPLHAFLRVRQDSDTGKAIVETSQHVRVPVSGRLGAAKLFRFLKSRKDNNLPYERNGHTEHIGEFTVDSFKPAVLTSTEANPAELEWILTAGCHRIKWAEILTISEDVLKAEDEELYKQASEEHEADGDGQ